MTIKSFFGGLLMAVGGLTAVLSGLCSLTFVLGGIGEVIRQPGNFWGSAGALAVFGGIPFCVGLLLYKAGQWLRKKDKE